MCKLMLICYCLIICFLTSVITLLSLLKKTLYTKNVNTFRPHVLISCVCRGNCSRRQILDLISCTGEKPDENRFNRKQKTGLNNNERFVLKHENVKSCLPIYDIIIAEKTRQPAV